MISRLLFYVLGLCLFCCCSQKTKQQLPAKQNSDILTTGIDLFQHGVASGDPLKDGVIIWTRLTIEDKVSVAWEVSRDKGFETIIHSGYVRTDHNRDYTIKVDVGELNPGTFYYYRFIYAGKISPIGRTKTLPDGDVDEVNLGIVSCSNYEFGYFNAYHGLSEETLDAILHLGDYIYEYGPGTYGDTSFIRKHLPAKEITSLEDYRTRYAQYRTDMALQRAHQSHPFIMIWDDHEIANDAYISGAQNHQPEEGDFMKRKAIAKRAYYEWQPIRENNSGEIYRSFGLGNLVDIIMLDERYTGRQAPPERTEDASEQRSMLGAQQLSWFKDQLKNATATWKIIGNQVIFAPCDLSLIIPERPINLDAWDGYAAERDDIRAFLSQHAIQNIIFVTGDTHSSWAFDIPTLGSNYKEDGSSCAVEIGTPSITSANWNDRGNVTDQEAMMGEQALMMSNPHLKYVNGRDHGYTTLHITRDRAFAKWHYSSDIKVKKADIEMAHEVKIDVGRNKLGLRSE